MKVNFENTVFDGTVENILIDRTFVYIQIAAVFDTIGGVFPRSTRITPVSFIIIVENYSGTEIGFNSEYRHCTRFTAAPETSTTSFSIKVSRYDTFPSLFV